MTQPRSQAVSRRLVQVILQMACLVSLVILLWPIAWMVSTSLKSPDQVFANPPQWIPAHPSLASYRGALSPVIARSLLNSIIIAAGAAVLATVAGAMCAYGIARAKGTWSAVVLAMLLSSLGLPIPMLMVTMYFMFAKAGMLDGYGALILANTAITMPVVVWMMRDFFESLPYEIEEAAYIDGAGLLYAFWKIVVPMAMPGLAAAAIFVFVTSWNEFVFGLTFTSSEAMRPLPAMFSLLFLGEFQYRWGDAMAVAVVVAIPVMALFLLFQRYFVQGATAGAVKG